MGSAWRGLLYAARRVETLRLGPFRRCSYGPFSKITSNHEEEFPKSD